MRKNILKKSCGAFLMEALIAVVILSVGLTGVIRCFAMGIQAYERNREYQAAAVVLENMLTRLLLNRYIDGSIAAEGTCESPFEDFDYKISVEGDQSLLREVRVSVLWNSKGSRRSLDAVTYLFADAAER